MRRKTSRYGNTKVLSSEGQTQLQLFSVDSVVSRRALGKNTYDPSWDLTEPQKCDYTQGIDARYPQ